MPATKPPRRVLKRQLEEVEEEDEEEEEEEEEDEGEDKGEVEDKEEEEPPRRVLEGEGEGEGEGEEEEDGEKDDEKDDEKEADGIPGGVGEEDGDDVGNDFGGQAPSSGGGLAAGSRVVVDPYETPLSAEAVMARSLAACAPLILAAVKCRSATAAVVDSQASLDILPPSPASSSTGSSSGLLSRAAGLAFVALLSAQLRGNDVPEDVMDAFSAVRTAISAAGLVNINVNVTVGGSGGDGGVQATLDALRAYEQALVAEEANARRAAAEAALASAAAALVTAEGDRDRLLRASLDASPVVFDFIRLILSVPEEGM